MSDESLRTAGILLVVYPTVVFGGASLLWHWITRRTTYYDHPLRAHVARRSRPRRRTLAALAGHHLPRRSARLADGWKQLVRITIPAAALLLPIAFFLSIVRREAERPSRLVNLAYLGAISLTIGTFTLGIGLLRAT